MMQNFRSGLLQVFCIVLGLCLMAPVIYCLIISFMQESEIVTTELHLWPNEFYLGNYIAIITKTKIFRYMLNSFIVAFFSSIARVLTSSLAAYAFSFMEFRGKNLLFWLVLGSMIVPAEMLMVQNYFTTAELGLINTYMGMMIIYLVSGANIFLIRQHFMNYSKAVREASLMDGCGNWRFFWKILMPMSGPVLATVFISAFVNSWTTYLWPLMVTNVNEMRTVQVIITMLNASELNSVYGQVMAAAIMILIPSVVIFALFQRKITAGMMAGAVKE
jgi:sn-glycerol 3-phosphate transport system permease protein